MGQYCLDACRLQDLHSLLLELEAIHSIHLIRIFSTNSLSLPLAYFFPLVPVITIYTKKEMVYGAIGWSRGRLCSRREQIKCFLVVSILGTRK